MTAATGTLRSALAGLVGDEHVRLATTDDAVAGVLPRVVVAPASGEQVAAVLRFASDAGLRVAPRGSGSKAEWGKAPAALDLILSTERLDRVLEHAWGDMTATVEAGCSVVEFQQTLAEHGQRLALDPLWPARATIGGILATNDSGLLRLRFGSLRDLILGATVALPDGTLAKSGGKVVKNVAGYDLPKLMTGALGTLGVIVDATFRLHPLPKSEHVASYIAESVSSANDLMLRILDSTLVPVAMQLSASHDTAPRLDLHFEGIEAGIAAQRAQLERMADAVGGARVEERPADWAGREALWEDAGNTLICKLGVLPSHYASFADALRRVAAPLRLAWHLIGQAAGVGLLRLDGANDEVLLAALNLLRTELSRAGGSLVVLHAPSSLRARVDVWGASGDALPLMRRVKQQFDPGAILNPGRFVGGI